MNVEDPYLFLYKTSDLLKLNLIRSQLKSEGFDFRIFDENFSQLYPIATAGARIYVHERDFAQARLLLDRIENQLRNRRMDEDYSESDHDDIEYERQVTEYEKKLEEARPEFWIIWVLIVIIILYVLVFTL